MFVSNAWMHFFVSSFFLHYVASESQALLISCHLAKSRKFHNVNAVEVTFVKLSPQGVAALPAGNSKGTGLIPKRYRVSNTDRKV
jgi:hypothetical protein